MKYWAFLSYSQTDKKWGDWLHKVLETYRVPRRLIGKESRDGKIPERVYPIFRDREELPVSADLGANINHCRPNGNRETKKTKTATDSVMAMSAGSKLASGRLGPAAESIETSRQCGNVSGRGL
jgi:hypothetical protein